MDAFISYAHEDTEIVQRLARELLARGREVWVDVEGIEPADRWRGSVREATERADAFVFILSRASLASRACLEELDHAELLNKRLIAICVEEAVADLDKPEVLDELSWIMITGADAFEEGVNRLERALDTDLELVRTHTRILVRARAWELANRRSSPLLRGEELSAAEEWLSRVSVGARPQPTELQRDFIVASRRAAARRQSTIAAVSAAVALIGTGLAIFAFIQRSDAINNEKLAQSRLLATEAESSASSDASLSALLALDGLRVRYTPQAAQALRDALSNLQSLVVFRGHTGVVETATYSPDGSRVLTSGADGTARVWDARTGAQLLVLNAGGRTGYTNVWDATYSPDGTRIVTANQDGTARVWDAQTGRQLLVLKASVHGALDTATFIADGSRILTAGGSGAAVWSARTGARLFVLGSETVPVEGAAFSGDGSRILTASSFARTITVWDAHTRARLLVVRDPDLSTSGHDVAFSPDGSEFVAAGSTTRVWDARSGRVLLTLMDPLYGNLSTDSVAFGPDGSRIVTANDGGTAAVWDARDGRQLAVLGGFTGSNFTDNIDDAAFSPDGSRIVTANGDNTAAIWPTQSLGQQLVELAPAGVDEAVFSPDGSRFLTAGQSAWVWDTATGAKLLRLNDPGMVVGAAFSPDGSQVLTVPESPTEALHVWDSRTGRQLYVLNGGQTGFAGGVFGPHGSTILTWSLNQITAWSTRTRKPVLQISAPPDGVVNAAGYSPDGTRIVAAYSDGTARVYSTRTGAQVLVLRGHSGNVRSASFSSDGDRIVTAGDDGTARVWDARTGRQLAILEGHTGAVTCAAFSPDGTLIATGGADDTTRIWDAQTGAQLLVFKQGANEADVSVAFNPSGSAVLAGGQGGLVTIWSTVLAGPLPRIEALARSLITQQLTAQERRAYLAGITF